MAANFTLPDALAMASQFGHVTLKRGVGASANWGANNSWEARNARAHWECEIRLATGYRDKYGYPHFNGADKDPLVAVQAALDAALEWWRSDQPAEQRTRYLEQHSLYVALSEKPYANHKHPGDEEPELVIDLDG